MDIKSKEHFEAKSLYRPFPSVGQNNQSMVDFMSVPSKVIIDQRNKRGNGGGGGDAGEWGESGEIYNSNM